jgi:hypothetical protein
MVKITTIGMDGYAWITPWKLAGYAAAKARAVGIILFASPSLRFTYNAFPSNDKIMTTK